MFGDINDNPSVQTNTCEGTLPTQTNAQN